MRTGAPKPTGCGKLYSVPDPSNFVIPARVVATVSLLVSLGSVATLVVVSSVKNVDILSTVALALAILAFVVQLIVYVVQSASASQQLSDARALHGEMMAVLAALQERAAGTQKSIDQIHSQMIDELRMKAANPQAVAGTTQQAAVEIADDSTAHTPQTGVPSPDHAWTSDESGREAVEDDYPGPLAESEAAAIRRELESWPTTEEIEEIQSELEQLSKYELFSLASLARDAHYFSEGSRFYGPGMAIRPLTRALIERGLAEKIPGWKLATLSPRGRQLGRIFTANPPTGTPAQIMKMREDAEPDSSTNRDAL